RRPAHLRGAGCGRHRQRAHRIRHLLQRRAGPPGRPRPVGPLAHRHHHRTGRQRTGLHAHEYLGPGRWPARVGALALAGRANRGDLAGVADATREAQGPGGGRPMLAYVLDALRSAGAVETVVVVGQPEPLAPVTGAGVTLVAPGATLVDNLRRGFAALDGAERFLAVTSDVPLLTAAAVDDFVARARAAGGAFHYAVVTRENYEAAFPGSRRTWVRLRDGTFTGGNLFLAEASVARRR